MSTELIIAGIKATLRAAQAGADLYSEHARDRAVFLPDIDLPTGSERSKLREFLLEKPDLIPTTPEFNAVWDDQDKVLIARAPLEMDAAIAKMLKYKAESMLLDQGTEQSSDEATMLAGGRMVEQWRKEKRPPSPLARMALTITDIGLEFIAANPSVLGMGTKGEKLVVAFATNMSAFIPDDVKQFGSKEKFANRVLGMFLRAGLSTLSNNASTVVSDENIAKLIQGVAKPIIDAFPTSITDQINYSDIVESIAGPAAEAALTLLAENTEDYFGEEFADHTALGAVTSALFEQAKVTTAAGNITDVFTRTGAVSLYQAGLSVAKNQPELFIKDDGEPKTKLFQELLSGTANVLVQRPNMKRSVGAALGAMTIEAVGDNAQALLGLSPKKPWDKVAIDVIEQVTGALNEALDSPSGAVRLLGDKQLIEIGRIIVTQVSKTPGMVGADRTEIAAIVSGMAEIMAADDSLLLSGNEWLGIIGVGAEKAAENPGKLFGIDDSTGGQLATTVLKSILNVAGDKWQHGGRESGAVLFGPLLCDILKSSLSSLAGNISGVVSNQEIVGEFTDQLLTYAENYPNKIGSGNIRSIFDSLIVQVVATGTLPDTQTIEHHLK